MHRAQSETIAEMLKEQAKVSDMSVRLQSELQVAQSTAQQLEAAKQAAVAEHASALDALRKDHASVVNEHEFSHAQLRNDLAASNAQMQKLVDAADGNAMLLLVTPCC